MLKVGIVGANGQVGAELCLLLAARKDIELIAICRSRSGSAFLRWHGIACRHGRVADQADAARLLSDCDIVVNSSLASGTPAEIRRIE
ncbi:MAG: NAD(P)H-binding protein, partial [Steroidobacteraceae bacterium]